MYHAVITVTLRKSILDPEGKAVELSLHQLGYTDVHNVRMGKNIEMTLNAGTEEEAMKTIDSICSRLLANPVMEDYHFNLEKVAGAEKQ